MLDFVHEFNYEVGSRDDINFVNIAKIKNFETLRFKGDMVQFISEDVVKRVGKGYYRCLP